MAMMASRFMASRRQRARAHSIYCKIMEQARMPHFYAEYGDKIAGAFAALRYFRSLIFCNNLRA